MTDAFGRAVRDHHRGDRTDSLRQGDGEKTREHPIEAFYFDAFDPESDAGSWLASRLGGPVVDLGAGAGRHALWAQERFETVAVETTRRSERGGKSTRSVAAGPETDRITGPRCESGRRTSACYCGELSLRRSYEAAERTHGYGRPGLRPSILFGMRPRGLSRRRGLSGVRRAARGRRGVRAGARRHAPRARAPSRRRESTCRHCRRQTR